MTKRIDIRCPILLIVFVGLFTAYSLLLACVASHPSYAAPGEVSGPRLKALGVVQGDGEGNLLLDKSLTRAELAVLLSRLYREEWKASTYTVPSSFKDEAKFPKWGMRYIAYSQHRGWLLGDGAGNFNPDGTVTGEQLAVLLLRVLGYSDVRWGEHAVELQKRTGIGIAEPMRPMIRGTLFDVLWDAIKNPVMKDGTALIDRIGISNGGQNGKQDNSQNGASNASRDQKIKLAAASMVRLEGYKYVGAFHDGLAVVTRTGKDGKDEAGFIDRKGNLVVPFDPKYTRNLFMGMNRFADGRSMFVENTENGTRLGYIDASGTVAIPAKYDDASIFEDGLAYVKEGDRWFYIDATGKIVFEGPKEYEAGGNGTRISQMTLYQFEDGLAMVRDSLGRTGFIDKKGNVFIRPGDAFDRVDFFEEDLAVVTKRGQNHDEKWGFINKKGELVVDTIYDEAFSFSEGMAAVRMGTFDCPTWGYINKSGKVAIPLQYCYAGPFVDGLAFVANGGLSERKGGYIDRAGNTVIPFEYSMGWPFEEERAVVMKDGFYGYIDKTGKAITDFVFETATSFESGVAVVTKNDRFGIIGLDGTFVVEPIYDAIDLQSDEGIYVLKIGTIHWILDLDFD